MLYITGIYALNLPCQLNTTGDWHTASLDWANLKMMDSEDMFFKDYGIENNHKIPEHNGNFSVANHIRASLDLLQLGKFSLAQGMNKDFICNDSYNDEIFTKVYTMRVLPNWNEIERFMRKEYKIQWLDFIEEKGYCTVSDTKPTGAEYQTSIIQTAMRMKGQSTDGINEVFLKKLVAYMGDDDIRDLYDIIFICKEYWDELQPFLKNNLTNTLSVKGIEHFDFLVREQAGRLTDKNKLKADFLELCEKAGVIVER
jgi:hypothetical protein